MSKKAEQKLKILYLLKIFSEETDEEHSLTLQELIARLGDYGISAERKSLYDDIASLESFGYDIERIKSKSYSYYLGARDFQLAELKLLVDAVQCAKFITTKKTDELIKKLEGLSSKYEASGLQRQVYVLNRVKTPNEYIYYNTDFIHSAISMNKQIKFKYYEWVLDFSDSERVKRSMRRKGADYIISPWALTWEDENYYLIAYDSVSGIRKHFRVDKMSQIAVLELDREGEKDFKNFDMAKYCKKNFGMFGGTEEEVRIIFENSLIGVVVDRFGKDVFITKADDEHFSVVITADISPIFLSWIFSFGNKAKVVSPDSVALAVKEQAEQIAALYN